MEDPNRRLGKPTGEGGNGRATLGRNDRNGAPELGNVLDPAADWSDGGKELGVPVGEIPRPMTAHRETGEIHAVRLHVELAHGLPEGGERHLRRCSDPLRVRWHLGEDDDGGKVPGLSADRGAETHSGLKQSIRAPLAGTVQEENDRPAGLGRIVGRDIHLIAVALAGHGHRSVEESGLDTLGADGRSEQEEEECRVSETPFAHVRLPDRKSVSRWARHDQKHTRHTPRRARRRAATMEWDRATSFGPRHAALFLAVKHPPYEWRSTSDCRPRPSQPRCGPRKTGPPAP